MNDAPPSIDNHNGNNNNNNNNSLHQPELNTTNMDTSAPPREDQRNGTDNNNLIGSAHLRPVFMGNLEYNCTVEDIEDLFVRPMQGMDPVSIDRVDLKRGYAFVFFQEARSQTDKVKLERYVEEINGMNLPKVSRQLRAEFARGDGRIRRKEEDRRRHITPCETLFVVNFSAETTKREDLEMLFSPYGEIVRIDMKKNYAFVQFTKVEDATRAKDETNGGRLDQSVITVEYVAQRQDRKEFRERGRDSRDRGHGSRHRSPPRGRYDDRRRSRSPPRERSDDYRRGGRDRSPPRGGGGDRYDDYRRGGRSRSRSPIYRYRSRSASPRRDTWRGKDDYRRGGDRDYRDTGRARSNDRDFRDNRGYK